MAAVGGHFPAAIFCGEREQAALADAASGNLRGQVAFALARRAHVREKNRHDVRAMRPLSHDFHGRDAQTFFKNLA